MLIINLFLIYFFFIFKKRNIEGRKALKKNEEVRVGPDQVSEWLTDIIKDSDSQHLPTSAHQLWSHGPKVADMVLLRSPITIKDVKMRSEG